MKTLGYQIILVYIENLWDIINENLKYYFQTIGIPRSYINSPIIQKINIPKLPVLTTEDGIKHIKDFFGSLLDSLNLR